MLRAILIGLVISITTFIVVKNSISYTEVKTIDSSNYSIDYKEISSQCVSEIVELSLDETKDILSFSLDSKNNTDVKYLIENKIAHCVGYAALCNSIINSYDHPDIKSKHVRAKIGIFGFDIHSLFSHPAFKDHDVCVVENTKTGEIYYIDPSLSEVLGNLVVKQDLY